MFETDGRLRWGKALSHCESDDVEAVGFMKNGELLVTSSYRQGAELRTDLLAYDSATGALIWKYSLRAGTPGKLYATIGVDRFDESAVVAIKTSEDGVRVLRIGSAGRLIAEMSLSSRELGFDVDDDLSGVAVSFRAGGARSDVLLGFASGVVLLDASFHRVWTRLHRDSATGGPVASTEVAMCEPDRYTLVTDGNEHLESEHVIRSFDRTGHELWAHRVSVNDGTTSYRGPTAVLRKERINLYCNEQNLPDLIAIGTDHGYDRTQQIVAVTFRSTGVLLFKYGGTLPAGYHLDGAAGVGAGAPTFLSSPGGKYRLLDRADLGWRTLP
jgi:outer membrane protein assembly factor BamB